MFFQSVLLIVKQYFMPQLTIKTTRSILSHLSLKFAREQFPQPTITNENQRLPRGSCLLTRWLYNYFHSWSVKNLRLEDFHVSRGHFLLEGEVKPDNYTDLHKNQQFALSKQISKHTFELKKNTQNHNGLKAQLFIFFISSQCFSQ